MKRLFEGFDERHIGLEEQSWDSWDPRKFSVLLDEAAGFHPIERITPFTPGRRRNRARRFRAIGWLLSQIECQVCRRRGGVRYLVRIRNYVDVDQSRRTQKGYADYLVRLLRGMRDSVRSDVYVRRILWLPPDVPEANLSHIEARIAREIELTSSSRRIRGAPPRLFSQWLILRARGGTESWISHVEEEIDIPAEREDLYGQLNKLRERILSIPTSQSPGRSTGELLTVLQEPAFRELGSLISDYYTQRVYPRVAARRRHKIRIGK